MKFMVHTVIQAATMVEVEVSEDGTVITAKSNSNIEESYPSMMISHVEAGRIPDESANLIRDYAVRAVLGRLLSRMTEKAQGQDVLAGVKKGGGGEETKH